MDSLENNAVQLVITSPSYWQLKDYGTENQIAYHKNYECHINNLNLVWKECHRVLENGCRLYINIGDQFARSVYYGKYKVIPIRQKSLNSVNMLDLTIWKLLFGKKMTANTTGGASLMGNCPFGIKEKVLNYTYSHNRYNSMLKL